jgi:hypothetical protein
MFEVITTKNQFNSGIKNHYYENVKCWEQKFTHQISFNFCWYLFYTILSFFIKKLFQKSGGIGFAKV